MWEVVVLVMQGMVVVLGEVMRVRDVGAADVAVVHVHDVRLAVLWLVVEDCGEMGDG